MKKISYLELSSLFLVIIISFNSGINTNILKESTNIDSWIAITLSYIIGLIPLLLTLYIGNYKSHLNIHKKNIALFGKYLGTMINIIISIIIFIIAITLLYNIIDFITTQFLYHTPMFLTNILLISLAIYGANKGIHVILHTSLILMIINIIIFITNNLSLINTINLTNLMPILKTPIKSIILSAIKLAIINTLPIIIILIVPKDDITNKERYHKSLIYTYIIGSIISITTNIITISALDIYLTKAYEFPEYMVLKKVKLFGFLERIENISSTMWITQVYLYITLIIYTISKSISNNKKVIKYSNIIIGIILMIITNFLFPNIIIYNNYLKTTFIYIISFLFIIYTIITITIFVKKARNKLT